MLIALLAATILMADAATPPQAQTASPAAVPPDARPKKAEVAPFSCHRDATPGARLPTRRCRTAAEVAEQRPEKPPTPASEARR